MRHDTTAIDAAAVVPLDRWDVVEQEASLVTAPVRFAMFIDDVAQFDPAAFALSENEAILMDPQQRLLLECSGEVLLDGAAKLTQTALYDAGVFVVCYNKSFSPQCLIPFLMRRIKSIFLSSNIFYAD